MKIVVTGASGLIGWHASARLHALNCAARFRGDSVPFETVFVDHETFSKTDRLISALIGADSILHFAGVNRGDDEYVKSANSAIAATLLDACKRAEVSPHIIYANSIHSTSDTVYGRSKRDAELLFRSQSPRFTNLILPHVYGECARPYYNNVTATFVDHVIRGNTPYLDSRGNVQLIHAGEAADVSINAAVCGTYGDIKFEPTVMTVNNLLEKLLILHAEYQRHTFPDLRNRFNLTLFNSYRTALYPTYFPRPLDLKPDNRGTLFEAARGGGGGQTFLSWTKPGVTRGNHFHLNKVERFVVLEGDAVVRIRRVLSDEVWEYQLSGCTPSAVDMPTLHTHSIQNTGNRPLLTLFWSNDAFNPASPDTYADPVLRV